METEYESLGDLWVARDYADLFRGHGLTSLDALFGVEANVRLDKPGLPPWRERLRLDLDGGDGRTAVFFLKRYRSPPPGAQRERIRAGARTHGTAWIEWKWARRLAADGVACARPVVFGEAMSGGRERCSAVMLESAPGESLERWAAEEAERCTRLFLAAVAAFVRRFHAAGYVHRDLYLCHIFFDASAPEGRQLRLIDLQRMKRPVLFKARWMVKDLAALNYSTPPRVATRTDRVRFLRIWLGTRRLGARGKRMARRICAKTDRIGRHDARRAARHGASGGTVQCV